MPNPTDEEELAMIGDAIDVEATTLASRFTDIIAELPATGAMKLAALAAVAETAAWVLFALEGPPEPPVGMRAAEAFFRKRLKAKLVNFRKRAAGGEHGKDKDRVGD